MKLGTTNFLMLSSALMGIGAGFVLMRKQFKSAKEEGGLELVDSKIECPECDKTAWLIFGAGALITMTSIAINYKTS